MARGPIPDKPADRPTVPQAAEALRLYYRLPGRANGGAVHIITEDGNIGQGHADWCLENARLWAERWSGAPTFTLFDVAISGMLAAMTSTQRRRLSRMSFYPSDTADTIRCRG